MRAYVILSFVAALVVAAPSAPAQSLAEVAAKEKERREKLKKTAEADKETSFSEEDLDRARRSGTRIGDEIVAESAGSTPEGPGTAPPPVAAGDSAGEPSEDEVRAEAEADWRQRFDAAEADRVRVNEEISTVERALADNTVSMFGTARQARLDRLAEAQGMRADIDKRIDALEAEGRQKRYRR